MNEPLNYHKWPLDGDMNTTPVLDRAHMNSYTEDTVILTVGDLTSVLDETTPDYFIWTMIGEEE